MSVAKAFAPPPGVLRVLLIEGAAELRIPIQPAPEMPDVWWDTLTAFLRAEGYLEPEGEMSRSSALDIAFREGLLLDWHCPAGAVGGELWVQEMFLPAGEGWCYAATDEAPGATAWLPAHVMPQEACRLHLRVVDVGIGATDADGLEWLVYVERV